MAEPEIQLPWVPLTDVVSTGVSALSATNSTWANFILTYHPTSGSLKSAVRLTRMHKHISICFDHQNTTGDTAALSLYLYREGGPAEIVCSVDTITSGAMQSDLGKPASTRYFCDEIGTITQSWPTSSGSVTEASSSGANLVAKLDFDARGYKYLLCLFTDVSATDDVRAWYTGIS